MASLGKVFEKDVESSFALIADGWYTGNISKAEIKQTKDGTGSYLNLAYIIDGPTMAGRIVFGMVTITNQKPEAESAGEAQLTKIRAALGIKKLTDTDQLIGKRMAFKVSTKEAKGEYDASNTVKDWKAVEGSQVPSSFSTLSKAPVMTPTSKPSAAPWAAKKPQAAEAEAEIF